MNITIKEEPFKYLAIQHGSVAHELGDFVRWKKAYENSLEVTYNTLKPALPAKCERILDIGAGMGGINIFLDQHYGTHPSICLLDGEEDPPVAKRSFETFSNAKVAMDFLIDNGVWHPVWSTPERFHKLTGLARKFDLVTSFAAYGFHIRPDVYLESLLKQIHADTVLIFDVRAQHHDWMQEFAAVLGPPKILWQAPKYLRLAYRTR